MEPDKLDDLKFSQPSGTARQANRKKARGCFKPAALLVALAVLIVGLVLPFTPAAPKIKRGLIDLARALRDTPASEIIREVEIPVEVERIVVQEVIKEVEVPVLPDPPGTFIPRREIDVASFYNEILVKTEMVTEEGGIASAERQDPNSYAAEFTLRIRVPRPNQTFDELSALNPHLTKAIPGLEATLPTASVSPYYNQLYENKTTRVQRDMTRLNVVLSRHNFFDLETWLDLTHPTTGRKAVLIQSEMDVVADGSDGDRKPQLDAYIYMSDHYQYSTSYGWPKQGTTPNPLVAKWQARLKELEEEFAIPGLSADRNTFLRDSIARVKREIEDMRYRSFLIAEDDPFIVISLVTHQRSGDHIPKIGDYAVIIHEDKLYPAICGDYGPSFKIGEASLRVARQINPDSSPYRRPISDLTVSYLIFPGSADERKGPPNYREWHQKTQDLLDEMGGLGEGYELFRWEDRLTSTHLPPEETPPQTAAPEEEGTATPDAGEERADEGADEPSTPTPQ